MSLTSTIQRICAPDLELTSRVQGLLDRKTKPAGSLGRLEALARRYVTVRGPAASAELDAAGGRITPPKSCVVVMAADHGVAVEGVSAFPQAVTGQMLANFAAGGAAINVLARVARAELRVVDMGTIGETPPGVMNRKIRAGSRNMAREPAMSPDEVTAALSAGIQLGDQLASEGFTVICLGEMGIANTTAAAALTAVLSGAAVDEVVGRGTGMDDAGLAHKKTVIANCLQLHKPDPQRPLAVLAQVGGLEIAGLAGLCFGAAANRMVVMLDGFIASSAALCAAKVCPLLREYFVASHCSQEPGHAAILRELELSPLLSLELRLGEGTGAALALPLLDAAVAILNEMATFESAGVSIRDA